MNALTQTIILAQAAYIPIKLYAVFKEFIKEGYDKVVATMSAFMEKNNRSVVRGLLALGILLSVVTMLKSMLTILKVVVRAYRMKAAFLKNAQEEYEKQMEAIDREEKIIIDKLSDDVTKLLTSLSVDEISALYDDMVAAHSIPRDRAFEDQRAAMKDSHAWEHGDWAFHEDSDGNVIPSSSYKELFKRPGHRESARHEGGK